MKDIDDRNKKLLVLKVNSANTVTCLQDLKTQLAIAEKIQRENEKDFFLKENQKMKQNQDIQTTQKAVQHMKENIKR